MQFIHIGLAILLVIILVCTGILSFSSRTSKGGGLQNPPHNIPVPSKTRKQDNLSYFLIVQHRMYRKQIQRRDVKWLT